jgi:hypothetical protein
MNRRRHVTIFLALLVITLLAAQAGWAKDGDVIRQATCSAGSTVKLKLSPENGHIEVELDVDQSRSGVVWRVLITRAGGGEVVAGRRVTGGPSGSFEVRRVVVDRTGADRFVARATRSGESCRVSATWSGTVPPADSGGSGGGGDDSGSDDHGGHDSDD